MISVAPIMDEHILDVTQFMMEHLNANIPHSIWISAFKTGWAARKPNNGFMLLDDGQIVGVLGAIYSDQLIDGAPHQFCNLTSLYVAPKYRGRALNLLARCLGQKDYKFTNFTANSAVEKMCVMLKFRYLMTGEYVLLHCPIPPRLLGVTVAKAEDVIDRLPDAVAQVYRDHRQFTWLEFLAIGRRDRYCLAILRPSKIRHYPAAQILYVSDPDLYVRYSVAMGGHLLLSRGVVGTRISRRLLPRRPLLAIEVADGRPLLYRGKPLDDSQIQNTYSELMALPV